MRILCCRSVARFSGYKALQTKKEEGGRQTLTRASVRSLDLNVQERTTLTCTSISCQHVCTAFKPLRRRTLPAQCVIHITGETVRNRDLEVSERIVGN